MLVSGPCCTSETRNPMPRVQDASILLGRRSTLLTLQRAWRNGVLLAELGCRAEQGSLQIESVARKCKGRGMSIQTYVDPSSTHRSPPWQIERHDRLIEAP